MATGIDKWLRGLEDLATVEPADLEQRVSDLRAESEVIQLKIAVLEQLLARSRRRTRRSAPAGNEESPKSTGDTGTGGEPRKPLPDRSPSWKRDAVLAVMRSEPKRKWSGTEIRDALIERGVMSGEEGTPTRLLLRRLADRGDVIKWGPATYSLEPPDEGLFPQNGASST